MPTAHEYLNEVTRAFMERVSRAGSPPLNHMTVEQARKAYVVGVGAMEGPRVAVDRVQDFTIPGPGGELPARLWANESSELLPVFLYLHGGGFVVGDIHTCEAMCRAIAKQSGVAVVAINYRLAPEHKYPAALDDSFAALQWLANNGHTLGLNGSKLAVGGDSAGGNLAASTALLARDAGLPVALQVLFYPTVQASMITESHKLFSHETLLTADLMRWFEHHARIKGEPIDWRREPLKANHVGVAPAWIGLAECDALRDEGLLYAQKLRDAGVPVDVKVWPGVLHDFINMTRFIPQANEAHAAVAQALKQAFGH